MISILTIVTLLISQNSALHLQTCAVHMALTPNDLTILINNANRNISQIKNSLKTMNQSLNPFNQEDRITKLQNAINQARQSLINIDLQTGISPNNFTYYYQQITPEQTNAINKNLDNIKQSILTLSQTPPLSDPNHPNKQTTDQLTNTVNTFKLGLLDKSGIPTAAAPIQIAQSNIAAGNNWSLGGADLTTIANSYQVGRFQNGQTCPPQKPYANNLNQCISCSGYFNLNTKTCLPCTNFDYVKRVCLDGTPTQPTNVPTTPTTPTNPTMPSTPAIQPVQRMTNLQNPSGILLPSDKSLPEYTKQLSSKYTNAVTCPLQAPFFDGTKCLNCPTGQYFSVQINACQTCATGFVYSPVTYHCSKINFYSSIKTNTQWISLVKTPEQIQKEVNQTAALPDSQACPQNQPFFDGYACKACQSPTPYFNLDTKMCYACPAGTVFSNNLHSCIIGQKAQTNLASPNLILDGHPLNEWKSIYFNNQIADPQLGDCQASRPYYDGTACIACSATTQYFSMTEKKCTTCGPGTVYDTASRECLSSSGNIVTQNPTLAKMAAGIFA